MDTVLPPKRAFSPYKNYRTIQSSNQISKPHSSQPPLSVSMSDSVVSQWTNIEKRPHGDARKELQAVRQEEVAARLKANAVLTNIRRRDAYAKAKQVKNSKELAALLAVAQAKFVAIQSKQRADKALANALLVQLKPVCQWGLRKAAAAEAKAKVLAQ